MPARLKLTVLALLVGALTLTACTGKDAVDQSGGSLYQFKSATKLGQTIPQAERKSVKDLSIPLLNGGTYDLANDDGKVVVLNFWASWCSPCRTEMPGFDSLYRTVKSTVDFVGVNTKDAEPDAAKAFVANNQISYPIALDEAGKTALALGHIPASGLPFTVVLDKQHKVAAVYISELQAADLQPVITSLAAGH
jgi:thiol-disulfide isomerase/thioredoxin